jgi:hypothetical protein
MVECILASLNMVSHHVASKRMYSLQTQEGSKYEKIDSKLYPLCFNGFRHLQTADNEKHFKEPKMKSGSSHLGAKPFFNSAILFLLYLTTYQHLRELRNVSY